MRCPLIMVNRTWGGEEQGLEGDRCIKEECAWWDNNSDRCAILELSRLGNAIGNSLGNIAREMTMLRPESRRV